MKFSEDDLKVMRILVGFDMAWEVGILKEQPEKLSFPKRHEEFSSAMEKFSTEDNEKYLEFCKYQNSISEAFPETISRKTKGKSMYV